MLSPLWIGAFVLLVALALLVRCLSRFGEIRSRRALPLSPLERRLYRFTVLVFGTLLAVDILGRWLAFALASQQGGSLRALGRHLPPVDITTEDWIWVGILCAFLVFCLVVLPKRWKLDELGWEGVPYFWLMYGPFFAWKAFVDWFDSSGDLLLPNVGLGIVALAYGGVWLALWSRRRRLMASAADPCS